MKNFKLREEKSFIKVLKEPPVKKKKINFHKVLYISLLVAALIFIGRRFIYAYLIILAEGQIELPKQTVNFADDIQLIDFNIQEGSHVAQGDTLFSYRIVVDKDEEIKMQTQDQPSEWMVKARLENEKKLNLLEIEIAAQRALLSMNEEQIGKKKNLLLAGVNENYNSYKKLQQEQARINAEIESLKKEQSYYRSYGQHLKIKEQAIKKTFITKSSYFNEVRHYVSPFSGKIGKISFNKNEICYKKQELMTIHSLDGARISAFFDPDEIPYIQVGEKVDIKFPDGSKSRGIIHKFHVSTYALPEEFQKKFEPTERNIVAEIKPLNEIESKRWKNFYKMDVEVRKTRFKFQ
ncbi:MAG: HlyD family efflux transporter periplasmic adaptor subunit [Saprospiraceae bacterium]|nr:HlyD family efflux transporter periplasmic adaptor subunit [Saprospiraceae bacterium]